MTVTCDTIRSRMVAFCDIRRSDARRRHPRPPRPQRPSHRTRRRKPAPHPRQANQNGLTKSHVGARNSLGQQARRLGRDHLVAGGRHHPGIPGRNHPVIDGRLHRNRHVPAIRRIRPYVVGSRRPLPCPSERLPNLSRRLSGKTHGFQNRHGRRNCLRASRRYGENVRGYPRVADMPRRWGSGISMTPPRPNCSSR